MKPVFTIAAQDIRLLLREKDVLFQMFVFPIIFTFVFGITFSSSRVSRDPVRLVVENNDRGPLGSAVVDGLPSDEIRVLNPGDIDRESSPVRRLVIPADFTEQVIENPPGIITLSVPEKSSAMITRSVEVAFYRSEIKVLATLARTRPEIPSAWNDPDFAARWTAVLNEPELVQTIAETATRREEPPSGMEHQLPGNIVMFVLMVLLVNSAVQLVSERHDGSFRRLLTAPVTPGQILTGKLLSRLFTASVQVGLLFISGTVIFGVHIGRDLPGLIVLSGAFVLCAAALGLTMGMWLDNRQHVVAVGVPLTLGMAALGGCWWPLEIVGPAMQQLGMLLPTGWAMRGYHEILSFGYGVGAVVDNALLLMGTAAVLIWLASLRVRIAR